MRIERVNIQNFRKLKNCCIDFSEKETIFVGANNSGKTSAMHALICFLDKKKQNNISTIDFTLSNWYEINKIGNDWVSNYEEETPDLTRSRWESFLPTVDIWLHVEENEIGRVRNLIPTLKWKGGLLGIRLTLEPTDIENLFKKYKIAYESAQKAINSCDLQKDNHESLFSLWPTSMKDFLDKELKNHFKVKSYNLDPTKYNQNEPQSIIPESQSLEYDPFKGLIKIDSIDAQRGFSDPNSEENITHIKEKLSSQLKYYYNKHLDPATLPDPSDIEALKSIKSANSIFDTNLNSILGPTLEELIELNYPGFSDPHIRISSKENHLESLNHDPCIQFTVTRDETSPQTDLFSLPENYNGLGYQNLISMVFTLIRFRDSWMRFGKASKKEDGNNIELLHLVLIEEPEAHLHVQVQQVFINKAYNVLRNRPELKEKGKFTTQLIISTHSSHIAHQTDFTHLRYFRREQAKNTCEAPCVTVVNLSETFGNEIETLKFAARYLKTTHCDLFFADGTILVEGAAERMLIPSFIHNHFHVLDRNYISLLEISGSHAHRLKSLIEKLGLLTLIVTDLDSIAGDNNKKIQPEIGKNIRTGNSSLKEWIPKKENLDDLFAEKLNKTSSSGLVRVAYQYPISVSFAGKDETAIPYTFEDALVLSNLDAFKKIKKSKGLLKKMVDSIKKSTLDEACESMFDALNDSKKAEMALELLFMIDPKELKPPIYIHEGLAWLDEQLKMRCKDFLEFEKNGRSES